MQIITVMTQKGGSGKSTTAIHLAGEACKRKVLTCVADLDPQGTAVAWAKARKSAGRAEPAVVPASPTHLSRLLKDAQDEGLALAVLDTPGRVDVVTALVKALPGLIVIPMRPTLVDFAALEATLSQLNDATDRVALVLTQVPQFGAETQAIRDLLAKRYPLLKVWPGAILQRVTYYRALGAGLTASEIPDPSSSESNAAAEMASLYDWLQSIYPRQ